MKINQKGFSVVEVVIVLVVIGLIGGAGWYVWQSKHKDDTNKTTQNEQSSQTDSKAKSGDFLTLTDFNAKIPLNDKTNGLKLGSVSASTYNEADKTVPIIASQLDEGWKCEADANGIKGSIGTISITKQAKRSGPNEPLVTKKVGDYTFGFEQSGANCTDSSEYQQLVDAFKIQLGKIEASN